MKPSRSRLILGSIVVALIVAGWGGWRLLHRSSRIEGVRNVVLISVDTCRPDRLSCYGYKRKSTPHIDALAKDGVLFEQALSPVALTTPAHSSMFTGTYPPTHGVRLNNGVALGDANVTLAEVLREAGFTTAAFVSGFPLDPQFGLNQGFETYDAQFTKTSELSKSYSERTAEDVSRPALDWLDQRKADRFFLFLHLFDAHTPYEPPEPFLSSYADDRYAGEIAYLDGWIGQVVDKLRALGAYDDTLVIVVGDHGESLGDHGEQTHGFFVYEATQHVPLVIRAPRGAAGRRAGGTASLVDLMPTVLDLAGLKIPDRVQGSSLRSVLEGRERSAASGPHYCEALEATQFDCSALYSVVSGSWKYIRTPKQELYDLSKDPDETTNLWATQQPTAQRLRDRLEEMLHEMEAAAPQQATASADPDAVSRLQSLGYVGGGSAPVTSEFTPSLEDAKDFLPTYERLRSANALFHANRPAEAEGLLRDILATRPNLLAAHQQLAQIALHERRMPDAVEQYTTIVNLLTATPKDPSRLAEAHYNLAFALRGMGRNAEAIAQFEEALRVKPDYVDALNSLGLTLARAGRFKDAIARYEEALRIEPDQAQVLNNLGNALRQTGRVAEAVQRYEHALRSKPDSVSALTNLALIRATNPDPRFRNGEEAVRLAERACAAGGREKVDCLDTLAAAYAEAQRFDEAVTTGERAAALARGTQQEALAGDILARVALYRDRRPYRADAAPSR